MFGPGADGGLAAVDLRYSRRGQGPGVVLVHGSWGSGAEWSAVARDLAIDHDVVAYDRRGHGRSPAVTRQGSVHDDVTDLAQLIDALGLAPAYVVGNSFGGCITLRLAVTRPDLVRGIAVHEPPAAGVLGASAATERFWAGLQSVRGSIERGDLETAASTFVDQVTFGPGTWRRMSPAVRKQFISHADTFLDELRDPDALDLDLQALSRFCGSVLLTRGERGLEVFHLVLDRVEAAVPHAEQHVFRGAGHIPHVTHPAPFAALIRAHVAALAR